MEETTPAPNTEETPVVTTTVTADPAEQQRLAYEHLQALRGEQNLPFAIFGSIIACLIGAVFWATVSYATEYQIGYMAIAIGLLVGFSNRFAGKGIDQIYGIIGAVSALLSCVLGNYFTIIAFASKQADLGFFQVLTTVDFGTAIDALVESFQPMDVLFYGIAIYEGYKFSFRQITAEEVPQPAQG